MARQQEKNAERLRERVAKFPTPAKSDGKLAEVDKAAIDAAVADLLQDLDGSITGLVELLTAKADDVQTQHALHAIVMRVGGERNTASARAAARALAATLQADRPKSVQGFVIRQLQLIGGEPQTAAIGKLLLDAELAETAAQALLAIKTGAAEQFRQALPKATGKLRPLMAHGLGTLRDRSAAEALRKLLDDEDRDTRLTAAWALANLPDGEAAKRLLDLAAAARGYERNNLTDSCLRLAENLLAADDKASARRIYAQLHESRTDAAERFVKEAAARGLMTTK